MGKLDAEPLPTKDDRAAILAIILVSYVMIVLDISIVITGLPKIAAELRFSPVGLSWVQNTYTLAFGGLLLLGARAGDLFGRRRAFIAGLALFTFASLAVGVSGSAAWMIGARGVQGVGAAVLAPSTLALLSANFPEGPERTRAVGLYAAVAGIAASVGLVLGGLLADWPSWRAGFFLNLPVGIALLLAARRHLRETEQRPGRFDLAGAVASTLGMTALVFGLVQAADAGWGNPLAATSLATGAVSLALFVLIERRAAQPMVPPRLFASRERTVAYAGRVLFLGAMVGFWFFTTQFLQGVLGYSASAAGLAFLPTTLPNFAAALAAPWLTRRFGNGRLLAAGLATALAGMAWLAQVSADTAYVSGVALPMVLIGIGQGATLAPLTAFGLAGVAREDAGAASGVVNAAHQLGGSLGLALLIVVFAASGTGATDARSLLAHRVAASLGTGAAMLAVALLLVLALIAFPAGRESPAVASQVGT